MDEGVTMTNHPLRAAVIGGGAGGQLSMNALTQSPLFELAAAADLRPDVCDALREKYPGLQTFSNHRELFEACSVDVVCVSTFPPSHEEVTLDALDRLPLLRGILIEKPLGHTAESGRRLLEAIKARNLPMVTPHNLLALSTPREIIERVRKGDIGDLKLVEIQCTGWDIINAGIHWLNFFITLTGNEPITHVLAAADKTTRTYRDGMQVETIAVTSTATVHYAYRGRYTDQCAGEDVRLPSGGNAGRDRVLRLGEGLPIQHAVDCPAGFPGQRASQAPGKPRRNDRGGDDRLCHTGLVSSGAGSRGGIIPFGASWLPRELSPDGLRTPATE
jgi:hypothetical protein